MSDSLADTHPGHEPPEGRASSHDFGARYTVRGEIGRGGLGQVLLAWDEALKREVAIKVVLRADLVTLERFEREAVITAGLDHPSIISIHERGSTPDGSAYYVMRKVPGETLGSLIHGAQTLRERLALLPHLIAVSNAVAFAHERKIIHRDLKPANVLVGPFGETVVIDWGLAKRLTDGPDDTDASARIPQIGSGQLTTAGAVMGTPVYMAPEQWRGEPVDERADVYALGVMMRELLTGDTGFSPSAGPGAQVVAPLTSSRRDLPVDLTAIVDRAMAFAVSDRYPNAKAFADDLARFQSGTLVTARQYSRVERAARLVLRYRGAALAVGAVVLLGLGFFAVSYAQVSRERTQAEQARAVADQKRAEAERATHEALIAQQARTLESARRTIEAGDALGALEQLRRLRTDLGGWAEARMIAQQALLDGPLPLEVDVGPGWKAEKVDDGGLTLFRHASRNDAWVLDRERRWLHLEGHSSPVRTASSAPDESWLVTLDSAGELRRWSLADGKGTLLLRTDQHPTKIEVLADGDVAVFGTHTQLVDGRDGAVGYTAPAQDELMLEGRALIDVDHETGSSWKYTGVTQRTPGRFDLKRTMGAGLRPVGGIWVVVDRRFTGLFRHLRDGTLEPVGAPGVAFAPHLAHTDDDVVFVQTDRRVLKAYPRRPAKPESFDLPCDVEAIEAVGTRLLFSCGSTWWELDQHGRVTPSARAARQAVEARETTIDLFGAAWAGPLALDGVSWASGGSRVLGRDDTGTWVVLDAVSGGRKELHPSCAPVVSQSDVSNDGRWVSWACADGARSVAELEGGAPSRIAKGFEVAHFAPEGPWLVAGRSLYDVARGERITLSGEAISVLADGRVITLDDEGCSFGPAAGPPTHTLKGTLHGLNQFTVAANQLYFLDDLGRTARWDLTSGALQFVELPSVALRLSHTLRSPLALDQDHTVWDLSGATPRRLGNFTSSDCRSFIVEATAHWGLCIKDDRIELRDLVEGTSMFVRAWNSKPLNVVGFRTDLSVFVVEDGGLLRVISNELPRSPEALASWLTTHPERLAFPGKQ